MAPMSMSRRGFIKSILAGGMLTAVGSGGATLNRIASDPLSAEKKAAYALIIDTAKCVGCGACVTACNLRNHLPEGQSYVHILSEDAGDSKFLPVQCQHCASPPCAHVCPTNATYVRDDGVVQIDEKLCVGCKYCMVACPYQARIYDEERGVADKCWLCLDYVLDGKEPACVQACVLGARLFGRMDDTTSEVVQLINSGRAKPLQPELGTEPAVLRYIIE